MTLAAKAPKKTAAPAEYPTVTHEPTLLPTELIPIDRIVGHGNNHRLQSKLEEKKIAELADSMRGPAGQLQNIRVYRGVDGKLHRVFGYRRTEAARRIGWKTIRADILPSVPSDAEVHHMRAIENLRRENLTPAEEALSVHELVEAHTPMHGRERAVEIAARELGVDRKWIQDRLYVVDRLTKKTRELVQAGLVNFTLARELATVGDPKVQEDFAQQIAERLETTEGAGGNWGGRVTSVEELRNWIANETRSLKVVAWKLDIPFAGKPACVGCAFNTATDTDLFGKQEGDPEQGKCRNAGCFDVKARKVGEAQQKAVDRIKADVKEKKIDKREAASIGVVEANILDFVKPAAVQRRVKAAVGARPSPARAAAGKTEEKKPLTEKDRRQRSLLKWGSAFDDWRENAEQQLEAAFKKNPTARAAALLLYESETIESLPSYSYPSSDYAIGPYGTHKNDVEPQEEKPVPPSVAKLLDQVKRAIAAGLPKDWLPLAEQARNQGPNLYSAGPEYIKRVCAAFGVVLDPPPAFEDFLPKDLQPKKADAAPKGGGTVGKEKPAKPPARARAAAGASAPAAAKPPTLSPDHPRDAKGNLVVEKGQQLAPPGQRDFCLAGRYVVVVRSNAAGESQGYAPDGKMVKVQHAAGNILPYFESELRAATPGEAEEFENKRAECARA